MAVDNKTLAKFVLNDIPPAPRGVPQVEVTLDIDSNGILKVSAKDKATGKEQKITITGSTGLSSEEVEKMTQDAEANASEDQKKKETIEARNFADNLVYQAEKALKEAGEKVPTEVKTEVEDKIKNLKEKVATAELEELKTLTQELSTSLQKVGASMYEQKPPEGTAEKTEPTENKPVEGEIMDDPKAEAKPS